MSQQEQVFENLRCTTLQLPSAYLGPPSPLPPLATLKYIADEIQADESVQEEARTYLNYGCDTPLLPYSELNDYGRKRWPTTHKAIILENEYLRATFLPELGGRLWSLVHKPTDRELLYVNDVFQPTNQAVRNAWFSGGVEWNVSLRGHSPFTCAPLFAATHEGEEGSSVLRMYEYERVRGVPFVIECSLPAGSEFLLIQVRLFNPHDKTIPMYWWSNAAVPEQDGGRVLVSAEHVYRYAYADRMKRLSLPVINGLDSSYPAQQHQTADYFYDVPDARRPWIAAVDREGFGLLQTSTNRMRGRKMFVWGQSAGGRRWQKFLSGGDRRYLEIQSGLARTQYECLPMPPDTEWTWLEAYGPIQCDPSLSNSTDWKVATGHIEELLARLLPSTDLENRLMASSRLRSVDDQKLLHRGSGWGALERRRLKQLGRKPDSVFRLFTDDSISDQENPWLCLLDEGELPCGEPGDAPGAWMVGESWNKRLDAELGAGRGNHWLSWLHMGVMAWHDNDRGKARTAWQRSYRLQPNAWALRNLGVLEQSAGNKMEAIRLYGDAVRMLPKQQQLAVEYAGLLLNCGELEKVVGLSDLFPRNPRLQLLCAQAFVQVGEPDQARQLLTNDFELPDLREGETVLTDLWRCLQKCAPPPESIDFRMTMIQSTD